MTKKCLSDITLYGSVKWLRSDNVIEFTSENDETFLINNNIIHKKSALYSPYQNDTAERSWGSLFKIEKSLLIELKLPKCLWAYTIMTATYIRNICASQRTGKTAFKMFTGCKPNFGNMYIFGTVMLKYKVERN